MSELRISTYPINMPPNPLEIHELTFIDMPETEEIIDSGMEEILVPGMFREFVKRINSVYNQQFDEEPIEV